MNLKMSSLDGVLEQCDSCSLSLKQLMSSAAVSILSRVKVAQNFLAGFEMF